MNALIEVPVTKVFILKDSGLKGNQMYMLSATELFPSPDIPKRLRYIPVLRYFSNSVII
jgi:hypothetical protein